MEDAVLYICFHTHTWIRAILNIYIYTNYSKHVLELVFSSHSHFTTPPICVKPTHTYITHNRNITLITTDVSYRFKLHVRDTYVYRSYTGFHTWCLIHILLFTICDMLLYHNKWIWKSYTRYAHMTMVLMKYSLIFPEFTYILWSP